MNTTLATKQIRLQNWAAIIKDQKASGLKVIDYCRQHNISKDAYYYWFKKLKETALAESGFVEISQPMPSTNSFCHSDQTGSFSISYKGMDIMIPVSIPKETLSMLFEVMTHAE